MIRVNLKLLFLSNGVFSSRWKYLDCRFPSVDQPVVVVKPKQRLITMPTMWLTDSQSRFHAYILSMQLLKELLTCGLEVGVAFCSGGRYDYITNPLHKSQILSSHLGGFFLIGGVILFFDRAMYVASLLSQSQGRSNEISGWPWEMYAARRSLYRFAHPY